MKVVHDYLSVAAFIYALIIIIGIIMIIFWDFDSLQKTWFILYSILWLGFGIILLYGVWAKNQNNPLMTVMIMILLLVVYWLILSSIFLN